MRLTAVLILALLLEVNGATFAQHITINKKNAPVVSVLKEIRKQSGFDFYYDSQTIPKSLKIDVLINNASIEQALDASLKGLNLIYQQEGKIISIKRKEISMSSYQASGAVRFDVSGRISDEKGQALTGVNILNPKLGKRATTDKDGNYHIEAEEGDLLVISFVGYRSLEIRVAKEKVINLSLAVDVARLDPVVVLGYSRQKASELTGSVQVIQGEKLREGVSTVNAAAMLKGIATGLYIVENGGSVSNRGQVLLRGQSSFNDASNTNYGPLIVVDGVITNASNLQDIVDPMDIESINILRDAASTAIYGSRAAQGVVQIVTKRGQQGKLQINFGLNFGKVQNNRAVRFMNTQEAAAHITKYMQTEYDQSSSLKSMYPTFDQYFNTTKPFTQAELATNNQWDNNTFFSDGNQRDYNLSIAGGNEQTKVYTAVKWAKQDGTLLDNNVDRKSIRFNIDQKLSDKLTFSLNTNAMLDTYTSTTSETQYYLYQPWVSSTDSNGNFAYSIPNYRYSSSGARAAISYDNPLFSHGYNTEINKRLNLLGTGILKYQVMPWLSIQSSNTINYLDNDVNSYKDARTYNGKYGGSASNPVLMNGALSLSDTKSTYFLTSNLINFNKAFGDHAISAVVGQEYGRTNSKNISTSVYNTTYPGERNLGAFQNYGAWFNKAFGFPANPSSLAPVDKASFSLFSQVNDSYLSRYFASASIRRDASTNFGANKRYGTFYSFSAGWLINKEDFFKNVKPISNLKLRASYGSSGREAGADYLNFSTYSDYPYYNSYSVVGSTISQLGNDNLTWETTYTTNLGLDIGLFNRIHLNVDLYNKDSKNLLQQVQLPSYVGFSSQYRNVGSIRNKGLDIQLNSENIKSKNFSWSMNFNISFNKNKLTAIKGDSLLDAGTRSYYRYVGDDINALKAIRYVGVNADNGRPQFERILPGGNIQIVDDINLAKADGLASYQNVGRATPMFFGGWGNTFRYKDVTLSFLFNFSYGNKIVNQAISNFLEPDAWKSGFNIPQPNNAVRFWKGPGDMNANYPNFYDLQFDQRGATNINSSLMYVDGSYLRLRNIRLGYNVPPVLLKRLKIVSLNVYASTDNVFVIKSKNLYSADPEGATIGDIYNSYGGTGIASAMPRRFVVGLTAGF